MNPRQFYNLGYRFFRMPWEIGPRQELVELVTSGQLRPGRAVDLGCGTGANSVFLAQHGFDVTGIDFAPAALAKARASAARAGVTVDFIEDDLTAPARDHGLFNVLVDYGTLDDLSAVKRARYVDSVVPLAAPGAQFLLWCFQWRPRAWERRMGIGPMAPGEVDDRFGTLFDIEYLAGTREPNRFRPIPGFAAYLLTRHGAP